MKNPFTLLYSILSSLFALVLNAVVPPRDSEQVLHTLSSEDLTELAREDGFLPYHEPAVRALVWEVKYHANPRALNLAGEYLAELLLGVAEEELGRPVLIPMPMHATRRKERGHNHTELLCETALSHIGSVFDYLPQTLVRSRHTPMQQGLPRHKRLTNVTKSMQIKDPAVVKGRVCVVVDDVSTTGATGMEASRVLKAAGARTVHIVTLAHS